MLAAVSGRVGRYVVYALTILFFGLPIIWLLLAPTKDVNRLNSSPPMSFGSISDLGAAFGHLFGYDGGIFWVWAANSVWYTAASVLIAVGTSIPAGFALATYHFRGRATVLFVTLLTMIVPSAALILPLYLEMSGVGLVNTPWSVILPLTFYPFGVYMIYIFGITSMPGSVIEAARLDGCSEFAIMMRIFLPLARPAIAMITFFSIVGSWNAFFLPYIMLTSQHLATLQTGLQLLVTGTGALSGGNLSNINIHAPDVALAALISVLPILVVFLFAQRYLAAGQAAGAQKG